MNGRRDGFINIKDMYNKDVGKGGGNMGKPLSYSTMKGYRSLESPFTSEIHYRHRYF
jgi:hypothetical protein